MPLVFGRRQYRPAALLSAVSILTAWLVLRRYRERRQKGRVGQMPIVGNIFEPFERLRAAFIERLGVAAFMLRHGPRVDYPNLAIIGRTSVREQWQDWDPRMSLLAFPTDAPLRRDVDLPDEPGRRSVVGGGLFVSGHQGTGASDYEKQRDSNDNFHFAIIIKIIAKEQPRRK